MDRMRRAGGPGSAVATDPREDPQKGLYARWRTARAQPKVDQDCELSLMGANHLRRWVTQQRLRPCALQPITPKPAMIRRRTSVSPDSSQVVPRPPSTNTAPASTGARVSSPQNLQQPCVWILSMGKPTDRLPELKAHYESQAKELGYSVGCIETLDDGEALLHAIQSNVKGDSTVLLLNTDASAQTVATVQDWLKPRLQDLKQIGPRDGSPVDPRQLEAWQAMARLHERPVANAGAEPWTLEELSNALKMLEQGPSRVGSTPPRGSGVRDDIDVLLQRHEDVASAIQVMAQAGRLQDLPMDLALRIGAFQTRLESKRADAQKRNAAV